VSIVVAVAVVAAVALAGLLVLRRHSGSSPLAVVTGAPVKTTAAQTAQVSEDLKITLGPAAQSAAAQALQNIQGDGAIDFTNRRAALTFTVAGQTVKTILAGATIYEDVPQLSALTGGKSWLKLDLNALGQLAGVSGLGSLSQGSYNDPWQGLQYLRGASGPIITVGHEPVRGVQTTHYRLTVSLAGAAAGLPAPQRATIQQIIDQFGIVSMPVDAWIDSSGLVRRVDEAFDYSNAKPLPNLPAGSMPKSAEITLEFYGFGTPVAADVPPADQVADLGQILSQLQNKSGSGTSTASSNALQARMLRSLPAGYVQQPDSVGDTGPSDLEKAIRDDGAADARQVLTADGFVAGYQRLWSKGSDGQIIDFVYQFATQRGVLAYVGRTESGGIPNGASSFSVPGVPGARGFGLPAGQGPAVVVFVTRGRYLGQVVVHGPDATPANAVRLAQQQYQLLAP
jgi:hypothetical protein